MISLINECLDDINLGKILRQVFKQISRYLMSFFDRGTCRRLLIHHKGSSYLSFDNRNSEH